MEIDWFPQGGSKIMIYTHTTSKFNLYIKIINNLLVLSLKLLNSQFAIYNFGYFSLVTEKFRID